MSKAQDLEITEVAKLLTTGKLSIGDGYRAKNSELSLSGIPFARGQNINNGFQFDTADRFPRNDLDKVGDKISRPGDVVFTSKGTVGRFAFVRDDTPQFVYSPQLCYWRSLDHEYIEPRWLFYWMQSGEFFAQFKAVAGQTDMAEYVNLRDQRRFHISLPPLPEQRAIAAVLGSLDDKIELNRRMNATLEGLARALFQAWFVDFEPVRAKMAGRPTGLPGEIEALFPEALEVGVEGVERPRGWGVTTIGDLARIVGGGTPSTKEPRFWEDGTHYWTTPKDLSSLSVPVLLGSERKITEEGLKQISSGLLPAGTVLLSSRAPIGYLAIAEVPTAVNQGFIALLPNEGVSNLYLLLWARTAHDDIVARANGSTFLEISKANFRPIELVAPPPPLMKAFDAHVRPLYQRIVTNERQSRTLAALRDELLPRLMSGEVRVAQLSGLVEGGE